MKAIAVVAAMAACLFVVVTAQSVASTPGFSISEVTSYDLLAQSGQSSFYSVKLASQSAYDDPIYFANLVGSRYDMGYDYGVMAGEYAAAAYQTALDGLFSSLPKPLEDATIEIFEWFCDWQWDAWLSLQVPDRFIEELRGLADGGNAAGIADLDKMMSRVIVLANLPSDLVDLRYVFHSEVDAFKEMGKSQMASQALRRNTQKTTDFMEKLRGKIFASDEREPIGAQCSMFGTWGDRTVNGTLFSARNLDWASDLGLDTYKSITVWQPDDAIAHSAVGYTCIWGALTGMSSAGLSVAEANLEVDEETFLGFPWLLRLRYVMEEASTLAEAWATWEMTNNTVGFNHMVASAWDAARGPQAHAALALETMKGYTGYFLDNDPREIEAKYIYNNETITYGRAIPQALWRTNHGYDPRIRAHYLWRELHAGQWSVERYMFAYEAFTYYEMNNIDIDYVQAINITSILGDKGDTAYQCQDSNDGSNIISATYQPGEKQMWAAWENGSGDSWRPAACNTYVHFDMSMWF